MSLLMPYESHLGPGRPGAGTPFPAPLQSWGVTGLSRPACDGERCAGGLGLEQWRQAAGQSLADVRDEIDASVKARKAASHGV